MIKFFYNLTFVLLSSLGIGFLSRFREIITVILSALFVMILPDAERPFILSVVIIVFLSFFALSYKFILINTNIHDKLVFRLSLGVWLSLISPYVYYSIEWIIIDIIIYLTVRKVILGFWSGDNIESGRFRFLRNDFISGLISLIVVQILYSGLNMAYFIKQFLENF